jgi:hypothetical protein
LQAALVPLNVPGTIRENVALTYARIQALDAQTDQISDQVDAMIHTYPFEVVTRRWEKVIATSVERLATLHVATHGDADRYTEDQFKTALGAFPQIKQSGATTKARSAKKGYRPAMAALFMWTQE